VCWRIEIPKRCCIYNIHSYNYTESHIVTVSEKRLPREFTYLLTLVVHRRRSSVNFGGKHFCTKICLWKTNKMSEFFMTLAWKIFFPIFLGGGGARAPCPLVSYAYGSLVFSTWVGVNICKRRKNDTKTWQFVSETAWRDEFITCAWTWRVSEGLLWREDVVLYRAKLNSVQFNSAPAPCSLLQLTVHTVLVNIPTETTHRLQTCSRPTSRIIVLKN